MPFGKPVLDTVTKQPRERERESDLVGESKWNGGDEKRDREWGWRERTDCGGCRILPNPKLGG